LGFLNRPTLGGPERSGPGGAGGISDIRGHGRLGGRKGGGPWGRPNREACGGGPARFKNLCLNVRGPLGWGPKKTNWGGCLLGGPGGQSPISRPPRGPFYFCRLKSGIVGGGRGQCYFGGPVRVVSGPFGGAYFSIPRPPSFFFSSIFGRPEKKMFFVGQKQSRRGNFGGRGEVGPLGKFACVKGRGGGGGRGREKKKKKPRQRASKRALGGQWFILIVRLARKILGFNLRGVMGIFFFWLCPENLFVSEPRLRFADADAKFSRVGNFLRGTPFRGGSILGGALGACFHGSGGQYPAKKFSGLVRRPGPFSRYNVGRGGRRSWVAGV